MCRFCWVTAPTENIHAVAQIAMIVSFVHAVGASSTYRMKTSKTERVMATAYSGPHILPMKTLPRPIVAASPDGDDMTLLPGRADIPRKRRRQERRRQ